MTTDRNNFLCFRRLAALSLLLVLSACTSSPPLPLTNKFLDQRTGVTVVSNSTPLVLYRQNPSLAAHARNYVHLGPIEVNRTGTYQYFLWIGIWNTMLETDGGAKRDGFESVVLFADGEPLALNISGWTPAAIGASRPVYLKPVASAADAYYPVTVDQIRLIAEASDIRLRTSDASPKEYLLWSGQNAARQSFQSFLRSALF